MTYKINGIEIFVQPTFGRWISRRLIAYDGNGQPFYSGIRSFEMSWQLMDTSGANQLQNFFDNSILSGTVIVDLPRYGYSSYEFFSYSGCYLHEPKWNNYFSEGITEVLLLVSNIVTE